MTTYSVEWGGNEPAIIGAVEELDELLEELADSTGDEGAPYAVSIAAVTADEAEHPFGPEGLQVGVGHPARAFVFWAGDDSSGYGHESGVASYSEGIGFDLGGQWTEYHPDETRVTAETAKAAAREYVTTGERPTCLEWD
jgi:hypothetical protein